MLGSFTSVRWAVGKLLQGLEAENGLREAVREDSAGSNTENTAEGETLSQDSITTPQRQGLEDSWGYKRRQTPENTEGNDGIREGQGRASIYRGHSHVTLTHNNNTWNRMNTCPIFLGTVWVYACLSFFLFILSLSSLSSLFLSSPFYPSLLSLLME